MAQYFATYHLSSNLLITSAISFSGLQEWILAVVILCHVNENMGLRGESIKFDTCATFLNNEV